MARSLRNVLLGASKRNPVSQIVEHERQMARRTSSRLLSERDANLVAFAALFVLVVTVVRHLMYVSKYATLEPGDFETYHPTVALLVIAGSAAYVWALAKRGVDYWLAYFPALMGVLGSLILLALIYGALSPEDIGFMDFGPDWWTGRGK